MKVLRPSRQFVFGGDKHRFFVSSPHFAIRHSERGYGTEPGKVRILCQSRASSRCETSE